MNCKYLKSILVVTLNLLLTINSSFAISYTPVKEANNKEVIKVLSIDGGGVRGIIPAMVLEELEKRLGGKSLAESFDVMVGTSTGGLIALMLNVPGEGAKQKYTAKDIVNLYKELSAEVFNRSAIRYVTSLNGWIAPKFSEKVLEQKLEQFFGNTKMSEAKSYIVIPAYDIQLNDTIFFTSNRAERDERWDFYLKELARATSAAPTYFSPFELAEHTTNDPQRYTLIDGGMTVNNPAISSYIFATSKFYTSMRNFLFVSIGTGNTQGHHCEGENCHRFKNSGKIGWVQSIIDITMDGVKRLNHGQMDFLLRPISHILDKCHPHQSNTLIKRPYIRLDIDINTKYSDMDNAKNLPVLEKYAKELISRHTKDLDYIAEVLKQY